LYCHELKKASCQLPAARGFLPRIDITCGGNLYCHELKKASSQLPAARGFLPRMDFARGEVLFTFLFYKTHRNLTIGFVVFVI
jgi:hypothetical protein